jgi:hypothetical protein
MKHIRGKHELIIYTLALFLFGCGCKSMAEVNGVKVAIEKPKLQVAETIASKIKSTITGEVKATSNIGETNTTTKQTSIETTSVGGNQANVNDSKIMLMYIRSIDKQDAREAKNTNTLLGIISAQFLLQGWMLKKFMGNQDKDDKFKEDMIKQVKAIKEA